MKIDYGSRGIVDQAHEVPHRSTATLCDEASRSVSDLVAGVYM